jgi:hypothetical protein
MSSNPWGVLESAQKSFSRERPLYEMAGCVINVSFIWGKTLHSKIKNELTPLKHDSEPYIFSIKIKVAYLLLCLTYDGSKNAFI